MIDSIKGPLGAMKGAGVNLGAGAEAAGDTFSTVLKDSIEKVNKLQTESDQAIQGLAKGDTGNIHETMIAIEKANLSFNLMVQVRNKLVAAYKEIMRTQV